MGPRLKLRLIKIVEGLCRGNVVYHAFETRSPAEIRKQLDSIKSKRELKAERKRIQEENVKRKKEKLQKAEEEIAKAEEDAAAEIDENKDERAGNKPVKRLTKKEARSEKATKGERVIKGRFNRAIAAEKEARKEKSNETANTKLIGKRERDGDVEKNDRPVKRPKL